MTQFHKHYLSATPITNTNKCDGLYPQREYIELRDGQVNRVIRAGNLDNIKYCIVEALADNVPKPFRGAEQYVGAWNGHTENEVWEEQQGFYLYKVKIDYVVKVKIDYVVTTDQYGNPDIVVYSKWKPIGNP